MRVKIGFILFILIIVGLQGGNFLHSQGITIAKTWDNDWKSYSNIIISGKYAFCTDTDSGLDVLDIANPAYPFHVSNFPVYCAKGGFAMEGKYAYIIDVNQMLQVLDISNPASLLRVGISSLSPQKGTSIFLENKTAYIAFDNNTVGLYDVSVPSAPYRVSTFQTDGEPSGIFVDSKKMYVISNNSKNVSATNYGQYILKRGVLEIVDISDKQMPGKLGAWEIDRMLTDVHVNGNRAYVTLGWHDFNSNGLWSIDVSNPVSPRSVDSIGTLPIPDRLYFKDGYAYFNTLFKSYCIKTTPDKMQVSWSQPLELFGQVLTVSNKYLYTNAFDKGMNVIDISREGEPKILTTYADGNIDSLVCARIKWNLLFTVSQNGTNKQCSMDIYNLASIAPLPVSKSPLPKNAKGIVVSGNYACVKIVEDRLIIYDISQPVTPVKVAEIEAGYFIGDLFLDGTLLYVQLGSGNFNVYDIANPDSIVFRGTIEKHWSHVYIERNIAFVADSRLHTYDITDPANPLELGTSAAFPLATKLTVSGKYAYIHHYRKFSIVDIANPSAPVVLRRYDFSTSTNPSISSISFIASIFAKGNDLFIGADDAILAFDISEPSKPVMIGSYSGITVKDLFAFDDKIVCTTRKGINILSYIRTDTRASINLSKEKLHFSGSVSGTASPSQSFRISNGGQGNLNWTLTRDSQWINFSPASGTTGNQVFVSVNPSGLTPGRYSGSITISDPLADNSPRHVSVSMEVQSQGQSNPPFGVFEKPDNGSIVAGSIAVTGWALDDIGVQNVGIYREDGPSLVYIDDAFFVEGARPDVEAAYSGYPNSRRAGWGYILLTNYLPGGDGVFTLHAIAKDQDGNAITLGTRTVTVDNANSVNPFGTIDTPVPGGTTSGSAFVNFGWALTPQPNTIPLDGSTITVWVDGVPVGNPVYNRHRPDVAGYFPGYSNSQGAGGYFYLDTTPFDDGMHTIQWTVTDDAGNRDGIGSRFFYTSNGNRRGESQDNLTTPGVAVRLPENHPETVKSPRVDPLKTAKYLPGLTEIEDIAIENDIRVIGVRQGYNPDEPFTEIDSDLPGIFSVQARLGDRLEIQFSEARFETRFGDRPEVREILNETATGLEKLRTDKIEGFQTLGNKVYRLPVGSTLDPLNKKFIWQPGPGFAGEFRLVFIIRDHCGHKRRVHVNITIL